MQEALRRIEHGESLTDWARVRALADAEIEAAAGQDPDWQDVDWNWVAKAKPVRPVRKRRLTLALDEDVIDWFRSRIATTAPGSTRSCAPTWRAIACEGCRRQISSGWVAEERLLEGAIGRIRDVETGPDGFLYLLTDESDGALYRLEPVQGRDPA